MQAANDVKDAVRRTAELIRDSLDDAKLDPIIIVDDPVSHSSHLTPHDLGMLPVQIHLDYFSGQFSDLQNIENAGFLKLSVCKKVSSSTPSQYSSVC